MNSAAAQSCAPTSPYAALISAAVEQFDPINLQEMDAVALLNRVDVKYILTPAQLLEALAPLQTSYRVLAVDKVRLNRYQTLYLDTPEFSLYRAHHNGSQNRYKVRFRTYVDSSLTFFEVKWKSNKGRTLKSRLRVTQPQPQLDSVLDEFLATVLPTATPTLEAKLWNSFIRITLVNTTRIERLTIDFALQFDGGGKTTLAPNLVIAEVKQNGFSRRSEFIHRMHTVRAVQMSFSKYCIGAALHYPHLKWNNFKPVFLRLHKMGAMPLSNTGDLAWCFTSRATDDRIA
ncbi:MAG: VTC domain-containing protein [Chloroflexi bacterium]|nr:MAG: VTC domain-containing protein [Chloroflexota bacterium]